MEILKFDTPVTEAVHFFLNHSHSRIPIYKDSINNIVGVVNVHDVLRFLHGGQINQTLADFKLSSPILVPKTKSISQLFHEFQRRHKHLAIVVDEHGETVGLVTAEDILEEIVGDIVDEYDREEKMIRSIDKSQWEARGEATIEEVNETLGVELAYPEHQTVSLLILEQLHRFPKLGEKIAYENLIFQVKEMSKKKIETVDISKLPEPEREEED